MLQIWEWQQKINLLNFMCISILCRLYVMVPVCIKGVVKLSVGSHCVDQARQPTMLVGWQCPLHRNQHTVQWKTLVGFLDLVNQVKVTKLKTCQFRLMHMRLWLQEIHIINLNLAKSPNLMFTKVTAMRQILIVYIDYRQGN